MSDNITFTPIADVTLKHHLVSVSGVCVEFKTPERNERFSFFELSDDSGKQIKVWANEFWLNVVRSLVFEDLTYDVIDAEVRAADPAYNFLNTVELRLVEGSKIVQNPEKLGAPVKHYPLRNLDDLPVGESEIFAVIGKILWIGPIEYKNKNDFKRELRAIRIVDKNGVECSAMLWGPHAHRLQEKDLGVWVHFNGVKAGIFDNQVEVQTVRKTQILPYRYLDTANEIEKLH
ncbi:unnamed protein product [Caenorhabditis auriculariae]|uniref:Replication protein A OB domain-containing protein n=1 Tax=Caenorhabditis auriculariae TaxID=2777116 RepID=A0A8S1GSQ9_9PELO|nr:unnamed protein product [Caenorhabditis auriculariae]